MTWWRSEGFALIRSSPVPTVEYGEFEWDETKAAQNEREHGVRQ